jgi:hypothetical protein
MLFNPFPGDAIVDLSFATDQGPSTPPDFQGVVVPARGVKALDVGEHVRRRVEDRGGSPVLTGALLRVRDCAHEASVLLT